MKLPRNFFKPLAIGAPAPLRELPVKLERMIHFVPPHIEKLRAKVPELIAQVDVVLGNLEDAIPADAKAAARSGFIAMAKASDFGATGLWTRINCLNSPWVLDDITQIVAEVGDKLDVMMLPKVEGPWDIHYLDQLLAQLEARHGVKKSIAFPLRGGQTVEFPPGLTRIGFTGTVVLKRSDFGMNTGLDKIGDDVHIRQNTTFGLTARGEPEWMVPTIGDRVDLGCNVCVAGGV